MNSYKRNRQTVAKEAADWFVANRDSPDAQQRANFDRWLREAPEHVAEYMGVTQVHCDLDQLKDDPAFSLDSLLQRAKEEDEDVEPRRRGIPRTFQVLALAAGLAAVALVSFRTLMPASPAKPVTVPLPEVALATEHGKQLTRELSDGTVVRLNSDTRLLVRYQKDVREIYLDKGQVLFEVVHDASRPFHVYAGDARIVDVGTKFDVYVQENATLVTVLEGKVSVGAGPPKADALLLGPDDQVRVVQGSESALLSRVDAQRVTAWTRGQIVFDRQPLFEVAEEFNRYNSKPIEIATPSLRTYEVSGVFAQNETESFIASLRHLPGVKVQVMEDRIRVTRR